MHLLKTFSHNISNPTITDINNIITLNPQKAQMQARKKPKNAPKNARKFANAQKLKNYRKREGK